MADPNFPPIKPKVEPLPVTETVPATDPLPEAKPTLVQMAKAKAKELVLANWKKFALWAAAAAAAAIYNSANGPTDDGDIPLPPPPPFVWPDNPFGWIPPAESEVKQLIRDGKTFDRTEAWRETFWTEDVDLPVWRMYKKATGRDFAHDQGSIGSCVAHGFAGATEFTLATNLVMRRGPPQRFDGISREAIYGGGRINIKRFQVPSDGMLGKWAAEWLDKSGAIGISQGSPTIGPYTVERCRAWGRSGVPAQYASLGKDNPAKTALVRTPEEVRTALANGYFVAICSSVGFGNLNGPGLLRDADGFLRRAGSWPHCMFVAGYRADKKGFLIVNSWMPGWVRGPKGFGDEPDGSFWCRWEDMALIVGGQGSMEPPDSFAISSVGGFKKRLIEPSDWLVLSDEPNKPQPNALAGKVNFGWIGGQP